MHYILRPMKDLLLGIRSLHPLWQLWVLSLMALNFVAPISFLDRDEAILTLAIAMLGAGIGMFLVSIHGFSRLLGLMHVPWIPLVVYLWSQMDGVDLNSSFGVWMTLVIIFNSGSLLIDTVDVTRFLLGERTVRK